MQGSAGSLKKSNNSSDTGIEQISAAELALFAILGALWTAYSSIVVAFKTINDLRDKILRGKDEVGEFDLEHRKALRDHDWRWMNFGTGAILFLFTIVIVSAPFYARGHIRKRQIFVLGNCKYAFSCGGRLCGRWYSGFETDE